MIHKLNIYKGARDKVIIVTHEVFFKFITMTLNDHIPKNGLFTELNTRIVIHETCMVQRCLFVISVEEARK